LIQRTDTVKAKLSFITESKLSFATQQSLSIQQGSCNA